ncbi:MAG: hypothetical protein JJE15_13980 [Desulfobacteraceae bacterium]|nr:hypothetical protein [Desulfobacteraceae bacterium]
MKKAIIALVLAFALGMSLYMVEGNAQMGPGMMGGSGYGQSYCPNCGRPMGPGGGYGMGPGMMGPGMMHQGWGMGPGMMGPSYGMGPGMMGPGMMHHGRGMGPGMMGPGYGYGPQYQQPQKPMEEDDAKELLENYLKSTRNPNLKLGDIKDVGSAFEAEIVTKKDDSLADKIAVDKYTGWMRSVY